MLTLDISTPHPTPPGEGGSRRLQWRDWVQALERAGEVRSWYLRVARGAVVIFDLPDNDALHARLTEWLTYVPAHFEVYPLVSPEAQEQVLRRLIDRADER